MSGESFYSAASSQSSASPTFGPFNSSGGSARQRKKGSTKAFNFVADLGISPTSAFAAFHIHNENQQANADQSRANDGPTDSKSNARNLKSAFDNAQDHASKAQAKESEPSSFHEPPRQQSSATPAFTLGSFATPSRKHKTPGKGGSKTPLRPFAQPFSFVPGSRSFTKKAFGPEPEPVPLSHPPEPSKDVPDISNGPHQRPTDPYNGSIKDQATSLFGGSLFTGFSPMSWSPSSSTGMPFKPHPSMAAGTGRSSRSQVPTAAPSAAPTPNPASGTPWSGFTFKPPTPFDPSSFGPSLFSFTDKGKADHGVKKDLEPVDDCTLPRDSGPSAPPPPPSPLSSFTPFSPFPSRPTPAETPGINPWSFPSPSPFYSFKPQATTAPTWPAPSPAPTASPAPPAFSFGTSAPPPSAPPQSAFNMNSATFDIGTSTPSRRNHRTTKRQTPSSKSSRSHAAVNIPLPTKVPITPSFVNEFEVKVEIKAQPLTSPSRPQLRARRVNEETKPASSPLPSYTPPPPRPPPPPPPSQPPRDDPSIKARAASASFKDSGNTFFNQALYVEAETAYSRAITTLESIGELQGTEMAVLHSNRAGARIMIGKPVSALEDARKAVSMDPTFIRAAVRVVTCHMKLGECSIAHALVRDILSKLGASNPCYPDAVRKTKEVDESVKDLARIRIDIQAPDLSRDRLLDILVSSQPLEHFISYSEELAAVRVRVHLQSGRFHDALRALEVNHDGRVSVKGHPWRLWAEAQIKYHIGDLPGSLSSCSSLLPLVDKDPRALSPDQERFGLQGALSLISLPSADSLKGLVKHIKQLIELKEAGNASIKSGSFQTAVTKYTEAINLGSSASFSAVLHSNRAAAHQGLGSLMEAVADCGRAKALDPSFLKAHTRMASLFQELRRPETAEAFLSDLLSSASGDEAKACPKLNPVKISTNESAEITSHIHNLKALARWQKTPDHYKSLSLERKCADEDVRRAYRKAALKFHPDKALSACKYSVELPLIIQPPPGLLCLNLKVCGSQEIEVRLREEASILFNIINQANEELSDQARRRKVDMLLSSEAPAPLYRKSPYDSSTTSGGAGKASYQPQGGAYRYSNTSYAGQSAGTKPPPPHPGTSSSSYSRYFNTQQKGPSRPEGSKPYASGGSAYQGRGGWYDEYDSYGEM